MFLLQGWVEITFRLAGNDGTVLELPPKPTFYEGIEPYDDNRMDVDDEIDDWWIDRDLDDSDEDEDDSDDDVDDDDDYNDGHGDAANNGVGIDPGGDVP